LNIIAYLPLWFSRNGDYIHIFSYFTLNVKISDKISMKLDRNGMRLPKYSLRIKKK